MGFNLKRLRKILTWKDVWEVARLNQIFIEGYYKKESSYRKNLNKRPGLILNFYVFSAGRLLDAGA